MISRYFVILLAVIVTAVRLSQGAWIEAIGLAGLAGGLIVLKLAETRPALKPYAWLGFAVTAISIATVLVRGRSGV